MGNFTSVIKLFKVNLFKQVGTSICQGLFIPYVHKQLLWTLWFKEMESSSNLLHIRLLCPILAVCDVKENIPVSFSFWDGESPDIFLGFGDLIFGFVFDSFFGFFFSSSIRKGASVSWSNPRAAASRPWLGGATTGWDRAAASSGALATTSDLKKHFRDCSVAIPANQWVISPQRWPKLPLKSKINLIKFWMVKFLMTLHSF